MFGKTYLIVVPLVIVSKIGCRLPVKKVQV